MKINSNSVGNQSSRAVKAGKITKCVFMYGGLVLLGLLFMFPILFMIAASTKPELMYTLDMGSLKAFLPNFRELHTFASNYSNVILKYDMWKGALNSVCYAAVVLVGNILVNALAGFVMAKFDFPGKGFLQFIIIFLIVVPIETSIIPLFSIMHNLRLTGTVFAVLLPPMVSVFNIFLFTQFFKGIPKEYEEAAMLDGASRMRIFFSIVLSMSKPILATVATFSFLGTWNDYIWPIMVLPAPTGDGWSLYPIQAVLTNIQSEPYITTGEIMASLVVTSIPVFMVYIVAQKFIVQGFSAAGLKL